MDLRQNDSGVILRLTVTENAVPVDVSASVNTIVFNRPKGDPLVRDAVFTDDGTDGRIEYTLQPGDLSQRGAWSIQARCVFLSGLDVRSAGLRLNVEASRV